MPLITIDISQGKLGSPSHKERLIAEVTDAVARVVGEEQRRLIIITIVETPVGHRGIGGAVLY